MWKSIPSDLEAGFAQIWQPSRCGSDCLASNAYSNHIFIPYCIQTIFNPHFASKPFQPTLRRHKTIHFVGGEKQLYCNQKLRRYVHILKAILTNSVLKLYNDSKLEHVSCRYWAKNMGSGLAGMVHYCYYTCFHSCTDLGCGRLSKLS